MPEDSNPDQRLIANSIRQGLAAAACNRIPAAVLWTAGMLLILAYFLIPSVHEALQQLQAFKERWGWGFAAISTGLVAGWLPIAISRLAGIESGNRTWSYLGSNILFWAYKGLEIDALYRVQAWLFGDNADLGTIVAKVVVDQTLYAPLLGLTNVVLFYLWRDCGYSITRFWQRLGDRWFSRRILPVLISNWMVWIPACTLVYLLPLGLQLPIQNLILCFWVLILVFFTDQSEELN